MASERPPVEGFQPLPLLSEEETERRFRELVDRLGFEPQGTAAAKLRDTLRRQGDIGAL